MRRAEAALLTTAPGYSEGADFHALQQLVRDWFLSQKEPVYVAISKKSKELEPVHEGACETLQNTAASGNIAGLREALASSKLFFYYFYQSCELSCLEKNDVPHNSNSVLGNYSARCATTGWF